MTVVEPTPVADALRLDISIVDDDGNTLGSMSVSLGKEKAWNIFAAAVREAVAPEARIVFPETAPAYFKDNWLKKWGPDVHA